MSPFSRRPKELVPSVSNLDDRLRALDTELAASKAQQQQENDALKQQMNAVTQAHEQESKKLKQRIHALEQQVNYLGQPAPLSAGRSVPQNPTTGPATSPPSRPRRHLVVCIDGTSNQFSDRNTNVVELYHRLVKDDTQLSFYNSGIGTYATPSWKSVKYLKQVIDNKIDLAIAWNYDDILRSAYRWLSENYEDGDLVFLFGFSRGAYQIRTLAAMIDSVGLIRKGNLDQIPFAYELYAETRKFPKVKIGKRRALRNTTTAPTNTSAPVTTTEGPSVNTGTVVPADNENANLTVNHPATTKKESDVQEMCRRFKETFSRTPFKVHFAGAWDTVSSVGFVRDKTLPGTTDGMQHVTFFRHALALHERRIKFLQENVRGGLGPTHEATKPGVNGKPPHTKEVWFAGSHGDIGGGAVSNLAMDQFGPSLRWMMFEAAVAGLRLSKVPQKWEDKELDIHNSLTGLWHLFEYLPFTRLTYNGETETTYRPHRAQTRKIQPGQLIHSSALKSPSRWRAELPNGVAWNSLEGSEMVEDDPYSHATKLVENIKKSIEASTGTLSDFLVNGLKGLIATEPGLRSLRDTPGAEGVLMDTMGRYSLESGDATTTDARGVVADAALAALDLDAAEGYYYDKYYSTAQVQPIIRRALQKEEGELAERLEELFGPAQVQAPFKQSGMVLCVSYMPDGKRIASGCLDGAVHISSVQTGQIVGAPMTGHTDTAWSVAVSADGTQIASGSSDNTVRVWTAATGAMVALLEGHSFDVLSVAFSPDGRRVVSGSNDRTVRVWDVATAKTVVRPIQGDSGRVLSVAFSPDGTHIASGAEGGICVCNAETGDNVWRTETSSTVYSVAYSPNGKRIVAGCDDGTVRVFDAETGQTVLEPLSGHTDELNSVAFSRDGKKIASGSDDRTVRLWDAETGAELDVLRGHRYRVQSIAFSPDGKLIASASDDNTVRIWDATGEWKQ